MKIERLRRRLLWSFVAASMLTGVQFLSTPLVFGDVILVPTLGIAWLFRDSVLQDRRGLTTDVPAIGLLAAAVGFSVLRNFDEPAYGGVEAISSIAKLSLYVVGLYTFLNVFRGMRSITAIDVLRKALRVFLGLALLQQAAHWTGVRLPLLRPIEVSFDRVGALVPRAFGLFSEPSTMAIFAVMAAFFLHSKGALRRNDAIVAALSLLISASLAGIGVALLSVLALTFSANPQLRRSTLRGSFLALCLSAGTLLAFPSVASTMKVRVVDRAVETFTFEDASGSGRLFDSWIAAATVTRDQPIAGVGIGGYPEQIRLLSPADKQNISPGILLAGSGWNIFANVFAEMGLIGFFAVTYGVFRLTEQSSPARATIIAIGFATGVFFGWTWWFSLALANQSVEDDDTDLTDDDGLDDDEDVVWRPAAPIGPDN